MILKIYLPGQSNLGLSSANKVAANNTIKINDFIWYMLIKIQVKRNNLVEIYYNLF